MKCSKCGAEMAEGQKFCVNCGAQIGLKCPKCGTEMTEEQKYCPNCGTEVKNGNERVESAAVIPEEKPLQTESNVNAKQNGFWSVGRLVIGILSILLFIFITFQSCATGIVNTLSVNDDIGGTQGMFTALFYLAAGIVAIASRNAKKKSGPMAVAILYWLGAIFTIGGSRVFSDLAIWGALAAILGFVFMLCAAKTGQMDKKKQRIWLGISAAIAVILIILVNNSSEAENVEVETLQETTNVEEVTEETEILLEESAEVETVAETVVSETESIEETTESINNPYSDSILLWKSYYEPLTEADLAGLSAGDLRIARNEIYAAHGRMFDSVDLQNYFAAKPWYNGTIPGDVFSDSVLTEIQKNNAALISQYENGVSASVNHYADTEYGIPSGEHSYLSEDGYVAADISYDGTFSAFIYNPKIARVDDRFTSGSYSVVSDEEIWADEGNYSIIFDNYGNQMTIIQSDGGSRIVFKIIQ